jgi:hypothetical protein
MKKLLKPLLALVLTSLPGTRALAADMSIKVAIPRIDTAEYHRPYVAIWLEDGSRKSLRDVAVWYSQDQAKEEGTKWLKDLRQWWRASGRNQERPADGISGATRPVGEQTVKISGQDLLADLPPGDYNLVVEAAREKGGHELIRLPLTWPPAQAAQHEAMGDHELGKITVNLNP